MDTSRGEKEDVSAIDIRGRGERIPRIVKVYSRENRPLGERRQES
jgi:hypothetical protein